MGSGRDGRSAIEPWDESQKSVEHRKDLTLRNIRSPARAGLADLPPNGKSS